MSRVEWALIALVVIALGTVFYYWLFGLFGEKK